MEIVEKLITFVTTLSWIFGPYNLIIALIYIFGSESDEDKFIAGAHLREAVICIAWLISTR